MISNIQGFNHTWLSCKKKYKVFLVEYKNEKKGHQIIDNDKHESGQSKLKCITFSIKFFVQCNLLKCNEHLVKTLMC